MSFLGTIARAFGLSGLGAARNVIRSPWSDSSHLESLVFHSLYGENAHGPVTRQDAMRIATVAKGRDVLVGMLSRLELEEYTTKDRRPTSSTFLDQPEPGVPLNITLATLADSLLFYGRAWWQILKEDSDGFPRSVRWIPEQEVETNDYGQMIRAFGHDVDPRDSVRFDSPHDALVVKAADTIRRAHRLNRAAARAESNPVPSIDLHNEGEDLSQEEIKELSASWEKARQTTGVGYSSKQLTVNVLGQPSEQLMIDGRKAINLELARHMNAPEWAVGVALEGTSLSYSNRQSRNGELIDQYLGPFMAAITGRLSLDDIVPRGHKVRFNTDVLVREDTKTRYENYQLGKEIGLLTIDDIAEAEGKTVRGNA